MKVLINLLKFILTMILTIALISIGLITILFSTVLDKSYIMQKLEETDFYLGTYQLVESNFENYNIIAIFYLYFPIDVTNIVIVCHYF